MNTAITHQIMYHVKSLKGRRIRLPGITQGNQIILFDYPAHCLI